MGMKLDSLDMVIRLTAKLKDAKFKRDKMAAIAHSLDANIGVYLADVLDVQIFNITAHYTIHKHVAEMLLPAYQREVEKLTHDLIQLGVDV